MASVMESILGILSTDRLREELRIIAQITAWQPDLSRKDSLSKAKISSNTYTKLKQPRIPERTRLHIINSLPDTQMREQEVKQEFDAADNKLGGCHWHTGRISSVRMPTFGIATLRWRTGNSTIMINTRQSEIRVGMELEMLWEGFEQ